MERSKLQFCVFLTTGLLTLACLSVSLPQQVAQTQGSPGGDAATPTATPGNNPDVSFASVHDFLIPLVPEIFERIGYPATEMDVAEDFYRYSFVAPCDLPTDIPCRSEDTSYCESYEILFLAGFIDADLGQFTEPGMVVHDSQSFHERGMPVIIKIFNGTDPDDDLGRTKVGLIQLDQVRWFGFRTVQPCVEALGDRLPDPWAMIQAMMAVMEEHGWIFP
ncbi:MAG: hypothetical protein FJZ96_00095 [Chloroflexi bacterium]|nr:hypothetical protein [Chloroflexota bacterium]